MVANLMITRLMSRAGVALALLVSCGCHRNSAPSPAFKANLPASTPLKVIGPSKPDRTALVALKVKRALDAHKSLAGKIAVQVSGHSVSLSGKVSNSAQRRVAVATAAGSAPGYTIVTSLD